MIIYFLNTNVVSSKVTVFSVKESADQGHVFGALLTNLSKTFDCLPHNLLIAKLNAYGFDNKAVRFVYDYLPSRKQKTKISDTYSSRQEILSRIPQGSIRGPLLFNIAICDFFFIIETVILQSMQMTIPHI